MTRKQKHFLMKTLPEFILREQGRGFAMSVWGGKGFTPNCLVRADCLLRRVPACGTVACIGGSTQVLLGLKTSEDSVVGRALGLNLEEASGLFYRWGISEGGRQYGWPNRFAKRYVKAKTTLTKARVAAALCVLVGKTEGRCLHRRSA